MDINSQQKINFFAQLRSDLQLLKNPRIIGLLSFAIITISLIVSLLLVQFKTNSASHADVNLDSIRTEYTSLYQNGQTMNTAITGVSNQGAVCPITTDQVVDLLSSVGTVSSKAYAAYQSSQLLNTHITAYKGLFPQQTYTTLASDVVTVQNDFSQITTQTTALENTLNAGNNDSSLYDTNNCITKNVIAQLQSAEEQTQSRLTDINLKVTQDLTLLVQ